MKKGSFEAKKHAYRQTQDGVVISFVVHPDDISPELATAPLGTQYMIGFARIGDDGKPEQLEKPKPRKERTPFETLQPSAQAAILCNDPEFIEYIKTRRPPPGPFKIDSPAEVVRFLCHVQSRSEFNTDPKAANRWEVLKRQFKQFQTDARYAESRTH